MKRIFFTHIISPSGMLPVLTGSNPELFLKYGFINNKKERLQYLAAGTAGTANPQKTGYGAITDRAAG